MRLREVLTATAIGAAVLMGCGDDDGPPYDVTAEVISHETTQEIAVFSPDVDGSWPVVFAFHGWTGEWGDMAETATRLAKQGAVVFSANYRTDEETGFILAEVEQDAECAYRFGRSVAPDYGGDLQRPVTMIGTSFGATVALEHGLQLQQLGPDGSYDTCFSGEPRPDLIVGISGCYHQSGFALSRYTNFDASLLMIAGDSDDECTAEQTERAVAELDGDGWDVSYLLLDGANHHTPIFHDVVDGDYVLVADDPAGEETVQAILDAIGAFQV